MMIAASVCCCVTKFAIVIYNANSVRDDNFNIHLNGTLIGSIDNNSDTLTGRIFCEEGIITPATIGDPNPNNLQSTITLNMGLLISGANTIRLTITQVNGSGNAGLIKVGEYREGATVPGEWDIVTAYSQPFEGYGIFPDSAFPTGLVGDFIEINFNYP